eukprot:CAMPEP_0196814666 /NCGR_PEP_ID=MMETSP1362-20130617/44752_1 /TAXON_ID=163516 /ORGANISM="Leptocylindrus danicus, Strain CCMP1856" /LENGTH=200 /DNA_ID=CAMNT_0042191357 /DNA_START=197 /DNA_END=799 /DNA_ORIENTATION=+
MGVDDVELPQFTEPLVNSEQAKSDTQDTNTTEEDNYDSSTAWLSSLSDKWYPDEWYIWHFPVARTLTSAFWIYNIVWGGIDFILDYVCTTGLRATFWSALWVSTAFAAYSIYAWKPLPMTFTFARKSGLDQFWCMIYATYQGALAGIAFFVIFFCGLTYYVPVEDFWDWNCGGWLDSSDDSSKGGDIRPVKTPSPSSFDF